MLAGPAPAAPVPSSIVHTIDTSQWSPPSPDPSGLAYDSTRDRLLITDGEVDEMSIFAGANYYEASRGGSLLRTSSTLPFSNEPTGVAGDSGRLFMTDDDRQRVFQIALGTNGIFDGTDATTNFSTTAFGSGDPEGIAYDTAGNRLFIADGEGTEIYQVAAVDGVFGNGNDQVQHFDTAALGVIDPEAVEFDADTGTLYTIGAGGDKIVETTTSGALVSEIDTSEVPLVAPSALVYAPRSTDPSKKSFYISDRKVDNDNHPTENDGAIYEVAPGSAGSGPPPGDVRVAASSDDAEESSSGSTSLNSSDLELVTDGSTVQTVGMRFAGVGVPPGAAITSAYIQFVADESQSVATSLTLRAQAADNAATFTSSSRNISSRARTNAFTAWAPAAWTAGEVGANQRTPDLSPVVQEVVDRGGWAKGNAMAFIATGSGHRTAVAYDGAAGKAPVLHVEFVPPSNSAPVNLSPPTISGMAQEGQTLTAAPGTWSGSQPIGFAYQWQRCDRLTAVCSDIPGASGTTYTLGSADVGATVRVTVTASNTAGSATASSSQTATVGVAAPVNTSPPTISGMAQEGQTLTADPGTWSSSTTPTYTYQWRRCNASGAGCTDVAGATGKTYTLTSADVGATIRVTVTASNAGGSNSASSAQTAAVEPIPAPPSNSAPPTISGTAQEGKTLTAADGSWAGSQPMSFSYQWRACDAGGNACVDRADATSKTYVLTAGDVGATMRVVVTATNAYGNASAPSAQTAVVEAAPPPGTDAVVTAAGDIAGSPTDSAGTATLIQQIAPDRALTLGDNAYPDGTLSQFQTYYEPNWGRFKAITSPSPGNHDYQTAGAAGYFDYFGSRAPGAYYSFDVGAWHLISLDSEIAMSSGSAQLQWLQNDLAANAGRCTLAYWHRPRFTSGTVNGSSPDVDPLWRALYAAGADVVLNGHDHEYERFAPQNPDGAADINGIREFVVGTGGYSLYSFGLPAANSEARDNTTAGVLKLTLRPGGYDWRFTPVAGGSYIDSGSDSCARAGDTTAPSAPTGLTATAAGGGVKLAWNASSDDTGVTGYDIFRDGVLLERTTATTYTDATVTPQTTYSYVVKARDAAGNVSDPSNTATVTTAPVATVTLAPVADARVTESSPNTNSGGSTTLRVDGGSGVHVESDLRFTVPSTVGTVGRATLRVYAFYGTVDGPTVFGTGNSWTELGVTWANRPARTSAAIADLGAIPTNSWAEWDVTKLVTGPGTYSFTLAGESTDGVDMYSREAANLRPQLVVTSG